MPRLLAPSRHRTSLTPPQSGGVNVSPPPKADTYVASVRASNFLLFQLCAISGHMWATLRAQLLERLTADQRVLASSESTLYRQIVFQTFRLNAHPPHNCPRQESNLGCRGRDATS